MPSQCESQNVLEVVDISRDGGGRQTVASIRDTIQDSDSGNGGRDDEPEIITIDEASHPINYNAGKEKVRHLFYIIMTCSLY